jgi:hypothetical protein
VDEDPVAALAVFTVAEVVVLGVLAALLGAGLFGDGDFLAGVARPVRLVALGVVLVELVIPVYVFVDVRRRGMDAVWVHVAVLPLVNVLCLAAYLVERRRVTE